ncbi:hypothetical protein AB3480_06495 [Rhizobium mongolense]|uniref:hypothetical protein n=1 Tax=Rhizobium mongolense TaxID=57676 RepID=UPI0034A2F419
MAGYPQTAPPAQSYDPFGAYRYMQPQQQQSGDLRQRMAAQLAQSIMGQPADTTGEGALQLATGIGMGLSKFNRKDGAYPEAPGGASPSFGTMLGNFFTGRNNGGLY